MFMIESRKALFSVPFFMLLSAAPALADLRLEGVNLNGALWKGGTYEQENVWMPTTTPDIVLPKPDPPAAGGGGEAAGGAAEGAAVEAADETVEHSLCQAVGSEPDDLPVPAGMRRIDLELLYSRNSGDFGASCDRNGPAIDEGPLNGLYHSLDAQESSVEWIVPVSDEAGVWRVVVVYDAGLDAEGMGSWVPLELTEGASGIWQGTLKLPETASRLTYFIQAVDQRGNVSWTSYDATVKE